MIKKSIICFFLGFLLNTLNAQISVSGSILESDGTPLIGVNVLEKNTSNGSITDIDGNFQMSVTDENAVLEISYLGYQTQEIVVGTQRNLDLILEIDANELDEIIVVGYGVQKKKVVTGAISKVSGEDLEKLPVITIENSLQGRTSGVRVTANSGQPGEGGTVRVRGTTSINSNDPLYVVDGIPIGGGIDYLNQNDIESIEVLKDAAAASIYGARSSAGVILVTTKQGQEGKMQVNLNSYYGVQSLARKLSVLDATEYATLMNESSVASGGNILYPDPQSLGTGTDWQDAVFRDNAPMQNHDISISAANEKSSYFASFSLFDQDGIVSPDQSKFQRFSIRFNSTHKINDHITFGNTLGYSRIKSQGQSTNSEFGSPIGRALNLDPITPVIETDVERLEELSNFEAVTNSAGEVYGISKIVTSEILNPMAAFELQQGHGWSDKIVGNVFVDLSLFSGIKFKSSIGTDLSFWGGEGFTPIHYLNAANRKDVTSYNRSQNRGLFYNFQNTLSYSKRIDNHKLEIISGIVAEKNTGQGIGGTINGVPADNIDDASLGFASIIDNQIFYGFEYQNTLASLVNRLNYNYSEKYLLSLTMRRDGSSRFGANNRFGYFPSASIGWVLTEEDFLLNNSTINFFKIRGSWGVNGSDKIGDFRFVSTLGGGRNYTLGLDENLENGVSPNAIANPDLRWEQTTQTNLGFDAKIFRKLGVTLDIYQKETTDMLLQVDVPDYVGNEGPIGNVATLNNKGIELELIYNNNAGSFEYEIGGNISYNQNEITFLGNDKEFIPGARFSPQGLEITRTGIGLPFGYFYGYETDGVFQNEQEILAYANSEGLPIQPDAVPGDFKFKDTNGNGEIDPEDRGQIGDPTPSITYGFTSNVSWNNFDILLFAQGVAGNDVFKATRRFDLQEANLTGDALDRWTGEGTTNDYPRLAFNDTNKNFSRSSDFYIEDGSYLKIKTLQLGYSISPTVLENIGMTKLRFYVSGNNLLTFTKYSGYDPEIGGGSYGIDRGFYPQPRFFLFGLNASF